MANILPMEIVNKILIYRERHPVSILIRNLFLNKELFIQRWKYFYMILTITETDMIDINYKILEKILNEDEKFIDVLKIFLIHQ